MSFTFHKLLPNQNKELSTQKYVAFCREQDRIGNSGPFKCKIAGLVGRKLISENDLSSLHASFYKKPCNKKLTYGRRKTVKNLFYSGQNPGALMLMNFHITNKQLHSRMPNSSELCVLHPRSHRGGIEGACNK